MTTNSRAGFYDRLDALHHLDLARSYRRTAQYFGRMGVRRLQRQYAHDALRAFKSYRFYKARAERAAA